MFTDTDRTPPRPIRTARIHKHDNDDNNNEHRNDDDIINNNNNTHINNTNDNGAIERPASRSQGIMTLICFICDKTLV